MIIVVCNREMNRHSVSCHGFLVLFLHVPHQRLDGKGFAKFWGPVVAYLKFTFFSLITSVL